MGKERKSWEWVFACILNFRSHEISMFVTKETPDNAVMSQSLIVFIVLVGYRPEQDVTHSLVWFFFF